MFKSKKTLKQAFSSRGFTLIELLIVIAILGTLAVVVLVAINPLQQLARTRDAGIISGVAQVGHAVEAYATSNNGYPSATGAGCGTGADWLTCLVNSTDIATKPSQITNNLGYCGVNNVNGWCYQTYGTGARAIVFSRLGADANINRCATGNDAYAVYSTVNARGGIICVGTGGNPSDPGTAGYLQCTSTPCAQTNRFLP